MRESIKKPLLSVLTALDRGIAAIEAGVLSSAVMLMAALNIANVIGRNLAPYDLPWGITMSSLPYTTEINRLLIILITFIGIGYAARQARHIRMSALAEQLPGRAAKALHIVAQLGTAALLFSLAWFAVEYVLRTQLIGSVTPSLRIPLYLIYTAAPIGFVLGGVQFLLAALRNMTTPGAHLSFTVPAQEQAQRQGPL